MNQEQNRDRSVDWVPLMDYAMQYGVSLSTLRRHIKANKIPFKVENGRYLLQPPSNESGDKAAPPPSPPARKIEPPRSLSTSITPSAAPSHATAEIAELRSRLRRAQEEISELKMLVALYEEQLAQPQTPATTGIHPRSNPLRFNG